MASTEPFRTSRRRFSLGDDAAKAFYLLSEGNPGALRVLVKITQADPIDGFITLLDLDDMNIRGAQIWVAYKDVCGEDVPALIERVRDRDRDLVERINAIIPDGERAVVGGASYAHH